jgi:predicted LPLAT superfamily acyltransferase
MTSNMYARSLHPAMCNWTMNQLVCNYLHSTGRNVPTPCLAGSTKGWHLFQDGARQKSKCFMQHDAVCGLHGKPICYYCVTRRFVTLVTSVTNRVTAEIG